MYNVLVVDDEPTSLNHICAIVEEKCKEYQIIAKADNGKEGLEKALKYKPDVIISDVKMPIMDGIKFSMEIKKLLPNCFTVIVSGYQDFEYMKGALKANASDYLLKPITPKNLKGVLDEITKKLNLLYYKNRNKIIHKLACSKKVSLLEIKKYFTCEEYYAGILRENGLLRRFASNSFELFSEIEESYFVYGRDEMESLFIIPKNLVFKSSFKNIMKEQVKKRTSNLNYLTSIIIKNSFTVGNLKNAILQLYSELDMRNVIGMDQFIEIELGENYLAPLSESLIDEKINQIENLIKNNNYKTFKDLIRNTLQKWYELKIPQIWMEKFARQILYNLRRYSGYSSYNSKYEFMIEDAFFYATNIDDLLQSLFSIFENNFEKSKTYNKVDSPEFFEMIEKYMKTNFSEEISIQIICEKFSLSQSYVSRLFRKYKNKSFNNYLTELRINEAKKLMETCPNIYIKDIAALVGYKDQFYFSRIFRTVTNLCPSDYLEKYQKNNN